MSKTVKEIKTNKSQIESDILDMLIRFEKDNEIRVDYVNVNSDHYSYEETEKGKKPTRKLKGVLDVAITINIENDPRSVDRVG